MALIVDGKIQADVPISKMSGIEVCTACGHVPNPALRLTYLAGCPESHVVETWFEIAYLSEGIAHLWDDGTYSALRYDRRRLGEDEQTTLLAWLDACHEGRTNRRQRETGLMCEFDDLIAEQQQHPNGDVTVTYRLPLIEAVA